MRISTALCSLILLSACSSEKNYSSTRPPLSPAELAPAETFPGPLTAGKDPDLDDDTAQQWHSDTRDSVVASCANGQIFANETCFDELNFT